MGEASLQTLCLSLTHANQLQHHVRHPDSSSIMAAVVAEEKSHGVFLPSPQGICSFPSLPPGPSLPFTLQDCISSIQRHWETSPRNFISHFMVECNAQTLFLDSLGLRRHVTQTASLLLLKPFLPSAAMVPPSSELPLSYPALPPQVLSRVPRSQFMVAIYISQQELQ